MKSMLNTGLPGYIFQPLVKTRNLTILVASQWLRMTHQVTCKPLQKPQQGTSVKVKDIVVKIAMRRIPAREKKEEIEQHLQAIN